MSALSTVRYEVDATEAIKALGINHPVKFMPADLNEPFGPVVAAMLGGGNTNAVTVPPGDVIQLDWDAIAFSQVASLAGATALDDVVTDMQMVTDPATIIAHELVHVAQMQKLGSDVETIKRAYTQAGTDDYTHNQWEADAFKRSMALAPLIKLHPVT